MGLYFNPGNESFRRAVRSKIYVDKTLLIEQLNDMIFTENNCVAVSHARRFGKSQAAGMIKSFYSMGCDSSELFAPFKISQVPGIEEHMNKYNVIHLDVSTFADSQKERLVETIIEYLYDDMKVDYPNVDYSKALQVVLNQIYKLSCTPFVFIIDEWDCVVRNHADRQDLVHKYLQFLHTIFKSEESKSFLALGYITGILPIKKVEDESALNNFREYTMLNSKTLTEFYGFTEDEVKSLCDEHGLNFDTVKKWYNGYLINGQHMYNPHSVYSAILDHKIDSYWKNTSSFETINKLITLNFDGLKEDILTVAEGGKVSVEVNNFMNDLQQIHSKDDALTALIHLGYLGYDAERCQAYMPNYEVNLAYRQALETGNWKEIARTISNCDKLLWATIDKDENKVAEYVELAHETYASILKYNDENALSCAITMAYFTAPAYYNVFRELPAGKGFADFALVPRADSGNKPAMIIELKYDKDADTAIRQIKEKRYAGNLKGYSDEILLVAINYDKENKNHTCKIETYESK